MGLQGERVKRGYEYQMAMKQQVVVRNFDTMKEASNWLTKNQKKYDQALKLGVLSRLKENAFVVYYHK
jgi:hypothetical protein